MPGVTVLGLVGRVSVFWVKEQVWSAACISVLQHAPWPRQTHPWDMLHMFRGHWVTHEKLHCVSWHCYGLRTLDCFVLLFWSAWWQSALTSVPFCIPTGVDKEVCSQICSLLYTNRSGQGILFSHLFPSVYKQEWTRNSALTSVPFCIPTGVDKEFCSRICSLLYTNRSGQGSLFSYVGWLLVLHNHLHTI